MMNERDRNILQVFAAAVRSHYSSARIWAFGSRVRGDASEYSDFDVCVVLDYLDEDIDKVVMDIAWETGFSYNVVISTVTYSKKDFDQGAISSSHFVKSILSFGIAA
jgi:uncharacterized protein